MGNEDVETDQRCNISERIKREIISKLQVFFHQHNHLIRICKYALENMPTDEYKLVIKADKIPTNDHKKRYSVPTINEIAIIMVEGNKSRDIILHKRSSELTRVRETHRSYDALQYPLLFWRGDDGYHFNIFKTDSNKKVYNQKK